MTQLKLSACHWSVRALWTGFSRLDISCGTAIHLATPLFWIWDSAGWIYIDCEFWNLDLECKKTLLRSKSHDKYRIAQSDERKFMSKRNSHLYNEIPYQDIPSPADIYNHDTMSRLEAGWQGYGQKCDSIISQIISDYTSFIIRTAKRGRDVGE